MIKIGTDIAEISRFKNMKSLALFQKRAFTKRENEYFSTLKSPYSSIAGAFAAKEAFSKFMGSGFRGFGLHDIEVLHDELGKPYLCFMGNRLDADVSISHSDTAATAVVCGEAMPIGGKNAELFKSYAAMLPKRNTSMNKGDCGRVFIVAGSVGMVGAACLCSNAALRCGSGLITLGTPDCIQPVAATKLTEVMTVPLKSKDGILSVDSLDEIEKRLCSCDVCAVGPGLCANDDIKAIVSKILQGSVTCVADADALNVISRDLSILKDKKCDVIITPHPGEMSRLTGLSISEIENRREAVASSFAKEYNITVVLKGHNTVIASPNGEIHTNTTGNSGMASGGMGDVLTGVIASFVGQSLCPFEAAVLGVFLHGLAGDIAADKKGEFGLTASDVIETLPIAVKSLLNI